MMGEGSCADCQWWRKYTDYAGGWGGCNLAEGDQDRPPQPDGREQRAQGIGSDSNYGAGFITRHDFGCVMWQPLSVDASDPPRSVLLA